MNALLVALVAAACGLFITLMIRAERKAGSTAPQGGILELSNALETLPRSLKLLEFRNVIVPDKRGTTEIDAVIVGNTGVFVIELKEYNAWIFGSEDDEKWTARYVNGSTHQFQNPLRQNHRHVMALVEQLGLPKDRFHSLVAFSGDCDLKTPMPSSVLIGGYRDFVRCTKGILLTDADVSRVCETLRNLKLGQPARHARNTSGDFMNGSPVRRRARDVELLW